MSYISTSKVMAKTYHKPHAEMFELITNLECDQKFFDENFLICIRKDKLGRTYREYAITELGLRYVVNSIPYEKTNNVINSILNGEITQLINYMVV